MIFGFIKMKKNNIYHNGLVKNRLIKYLVILVTILTLHTIAMIILEGMTIMDAIWLTFTSATTVGYGDLYAVTTPGRLATIFLLYIWGIAVLTQFVMLYFDYHQTTRESKIKGKWSWKMKNHIVFLNSPSEMGAEYFYQAITQLRKSGGEYANLPVVIVSSLFSEGIPEKLRKLKITHVSRSISDDSTLEAACVKDAKIIVILSRKQLDPASDGINFDLIDRLREMGVKGRVIVEAVRDSNRERLKKAGADAVLRPIRAYPELITRAILAPGSEQIIESLFDNIGAECMRYDIKASGRWYDIIHALIKADIGLPIAYEDENRQIRINPSINEQAYISAIFIIEDENIQKATERINDALKDFMY